MAVELRLSEDETDNLFDLAGRWRNEVPSDLPEYIKATDSQGCFKKSKRCSSRGRLAAVYRQAFKERKCIRLIDIRYRSKSNGVSVLSEGYHLGSFSYSTYYYLFHQRNNCDFVEYYRSLDM